MVAVRSIFDRTPKQGAVMQAEKIKVSHGTPPPRQPRGDCQLQIARMARGGWVVVPHERAKSLVRAARALGGSAMRYAVDEHQSCVKVLEAPWKVSGDHARAEFGK